MTDRPQNKNLKRFKKGESGNLAGRPKEPEEVKKAKQLTNHEFIKVASDFLLMDRNEIQARLQNPKASMLELLVGGIVAKAAKDHDHMRASFLLDRTIGKVKESLEVTMPKPTIIKRLNGEEIVLGASIERKDEE